MKKVFIGLALLFGMLWMPSCRQQPEGTVKKQVILDVDMSVDDMMSILYFLSCPDVNIRAITIENGISTVDSGAEIVLRMLQLTGHADIPVAKGTGIPMTGSNAFPPQWHPPVDKPFGLDLPQDTLQATKVSATELLTQILSDSKEPVAVMALGPMTNLAQVFLSKPGLKQKISEVYVSDGSVQVGGGIFVEYPQINNRVSGWNLWVDARAAGIVFGSGIPVRLIPLDITSLHGHDPLVLSQKFMLKYRQQASGREGKAMAKLMETWMASYIYDKQDSSMLYKVPIWDVIACMIYHHPEIATAWQKSHVTIREGAPEVAGQIITGLGKPNTEICVKGNPALLDSLLLETAVR